MFIADGWTDYEIMDAGSGMKKERWGNYTLLRPDPQAVWPMREGSADAVYIRSDAGGGHWEYQRSLPESWNIRYRNLTFIVRPTGFKHTGLFPEQAVNWDFMRSIVLKSGGEKFRALNLFAYTGGATAALASSGAEVVHVDAAKGMVAWAKDNLAASGLSDKPVRFIVDDALKFVEREQRRGREYEGIVMDPPSYGRGPGGELWKMEDSIYRLVSECAKLLSAQARFFIINSYTTGLAHAVLKNILQEALLGRSGVLESDDIGLPITRGAMVLPCGSTGRWYRR